jgi:hypothetical protein
MMTKSAAGLSALSIYSLSSRSTPSSRGAARVAIERARLAALSKAVDEQAPELHTLLDAVIDIEQGRRAGSWTFDRGRLWVVTQ